jgi:maltose O-acetyltransferase
MRRQLRRIIAAAMYYAFARYLPPSNVITGGLWRRLRAWLVRAFILEGGSNLDISRMVYLGFGRGIRIGDNSGLGAGAELHGPLTIGSNVMISPAVLIHTRNHEFSDTKIPINAQGYRAPRLVTIEDDVWVGARVIILPGVTIGRGSVVGAGTVLSRSVPPYSIVAGNPGRAVRSRLPE